MDAGAGCFDRFWMTMAAVVVAVAMVAGVVALNTNRVTAQETDWSQFVGGYLYLITPVGEVDRYTVVSDPYVKDGFFCAVVDQYEVEMCAPLTNVAGLLKAS